MNKARGQSARRARDIVRAPQRQLARGAVDRLAAAVGDAAAVHAAAGSARAADARADAARQWRLASADELIVDETGSGRRCGGGGGSRARTSQQIVCEIIQCVANVLETLSKW